MTRADFAPIVTQMHALLDAARAVAQSVGAADQRDAALYGVQLTARAIAAWEGAYLDEVIAGTRSLERWTAHGADLARQCELIVRDAGAWSSQWSGLADLLGSGAQALLAPLESKTRELRETLDATKRKYRAMDKVRAELGGKQLTAAEQDALFGSDAMAAALNLVELEATVQKLEAGVELLRTGRATLARSGDDVVIQTLNGARGGQLGVAPVVVVAVALGAVGVAIGIALSVRAFCEAAEEVCRTVVARLGLEAVLRGKGEEYRAVLDGINDGRKPEEGWGALEVLGGLVLVGGLSWAGWKAYEAWKQQKRAA